MQKSLKVFYYIILVITIFAAFSLVIRNQFFEPRFKLQFDMPSVGIDQGNLGIVIKRGDAFSEQVGRLYAQKRQIPEENIFYIDLPNEDSVPSGIFEKAYKKMNQQLPDRIQALVATWKKPFRVDCMSITSAMTFGFDRKWCQPVKHGCSVTQTSPYFNSSSRSPWAELGIRPTMLLTGNDMNDVERLIVRGIGSDFSNPVGAHVYLVKTKDKARSSRAQLFAMTEKTPPTDKLDIHYLDLSKSSKDFIEEKTVFVYQTGLSNVPDIKDNTYLPGAIADHLTSFGGDGFSTEGQMKAIRWLEAGATGSYGTVVEPCNFVQKYPNPIPLLNKYATGETLLEAYWKSVAMPGEGLFIGEPLARPFGLFVLQMQANRYQIRTNRLSMHERYQLEYLDLKENVFKPIERGSVYVDKKRNELLIQFGAQKTNRYRIVKLSSPSFTGSPSTEKKL